ncbi:MAG: preprotein translocase subunit YajC [Firmicutes bacterium]|nr:preprotein translocase subunit YajC [Bacillota bacterium]
MNIATTNIILIVVLIAVMYFVMIRPQQKQEKKNKEMRESLKIGDEIVTIGGIVGKITKITDKTVTIQTGTPNTKIELIKASVGNVVKKSDLPDKKTEEKTEKEETAAPSRDKKVTPKKLTKKSE